MGQDLIIDFLEKRFRENTKRTFTKEEIETDTGKCIKNYSLKSAFEHGDIYREVEFIRKNGCKTRRYRYRYLPNGSFSISNFRNDKASAIPNFHKLSSEKRIELIGNFCGLTEDEKRMLGDLNVKDLCNIGENSVGSFSYALRFTNYFKINDEDYFIPVVTEEASVVAAGCYAAKLCYDSGGIQASVIKSKEYDKAIGQVQLVNVKNPERARKEILENKDYLLKIARKGHKHSNPYDLSVESFDIKLGNMMIVNLHIDPEDAMGAAVASDMADSIAEKLSTIAEAEYNRGIISNYSGRLTRAMMKVPIEKLARKSKITGRKWSGEEVKNRILWLDEWSKKDIKRAVTNNKGIMNDVIGVARATAQDDRAIEAANSIYAIRNGSYQPLSKWHASDKYLYGELEMLIPCGIVGGEIKKYPKAELLLKRVLKVQKADQLAEIMASVGLAGNLAGLSMISSIGLKEGHELHRK